MRINPEEMMAMYSLGMGNGIRNIEYCDIIRAKHLQKKKELICHSTLNQKQSEKRKDKNKKAKESRKKNRK